MKTQLNLKNTIALIAVLLIWGYLIKSKFNFFSNENTEAIAPTASNFVSPKIYSKDTFALVLSDHDPFLSGKGYSQYKPQKQINTNGVNQNRTPIVQPQKVMPDAKTMVWPRIAYYGYVKNRTKGKKQACLIGINQSMQKMTMGETQNGVTLTHIYHDSIRVTFNQTSKTILKE
ncbi:MAG: hypothetical protein ACWA41_10955 [Putridiphycobacter sp.]